MEVWVSDSLGDNDTGNGTELHPYKTIQKGVDEVAVGGTVKIKAGIYDEGERAGGQHTNRVVDGHRVLVRGRGLRFRVRLHD